MIKEGDKVICIKDYSYKHDDTLTVFFKSGNVYEVLRVSNNIKSFYVRGDLTREENYYIGVWFSDDIELRNNNFFNNFYNYFIGIAEWRDKRIDEILNA